MRLWTRWGWRWWRRPRELANRPGIPVIGKRHGTDFPLFFLATTLNRNSGATELLRFTGAVERDPAIDAWMREHAGELGAVAHHWFDEMRKCGDEVRELLHDGCPTACLGDAPFAYVNIFTSHVNVGFFHGASLPDPARLLQGAGKFMRHVKLRPETPANFVALSRLIEAAYQDIKSRVEHG